MSKSRPVSKHATLPVGTVFGPPDRVHVVTTSAAYPLKKYCRIQQWYVKIKCSCGSPEKEALVQQLKAGRTISCGCISRKIHTMVTRSAYHTYGN